VCVTLYPCLPAVGFDEEDVDAIIDELDEDENGQFSYEELVPPTHQCRGR
jgi:hypothetical protein